MNIRYYKYIDKRIVERMIEHCCTKDLDDQARHCRHCLKHLKAKIPKNCPHKGMNCLGRDVRKRLALEITKDEYFLEMI